MYKKLKAAIVNAFTSAYNYVKSLFTTTVKTETEVTVVKVVKRQSTKMGKPVGPVQAKPVVAEVKAPVVETIVVEEVQAPVAIVEAVVVEEVEMTEVEVITDAPISKDIKTEEMTDPAEAIKALQVILGKDTVEVINGNLPKGNSKVMRTMMEDFDVRVEELIVATDDAEYAALTMCALNVLATGKRKEVKLNNLPIAKIKSGLKALGLGRYQRTVDVLVAVINQK